MTCISKPQLFNWQMCLLSEQTAVLSPFSVTLITITTQAAIVVATAVAVFYEHSYFMNCSQYRETLVRLAI